MYGLLLENLSDYVKTVYGEEKWDEIRRQVGIDAPVFSVHQVYPENLLNKLAKKSQQVNVFPSCFHKLMLSLSTYTNSYYKNSSFVCSEQMVRKSSTDIRVIPII